MARKIMIDTDPGIDDAMAIFYALSSPELDVIGLTTVFGNTKTPVCTQNALRLLEIAGRTDIPVAEGAHSPIARDFTGGAEVVHGSDGQGDTFLPAPTIQPVAQSAPEFLIDQIMKAPGEITLVALGPLANLALMLKLKPDITQHIKEIVLMGGNAFVHGNISPAAEANIWNDPEAADVVFGAQCPVTMIGLDVTEKVFMTPEHLDRIGTFDNPRARHLARILPFYRRFYMSIYNGRDGIHVHDSTTITYLLNPGFFKTVQYPVRVETASFSRGKTWPSFGHSDQAAAWEGRPRVTITVEVDGLAAVEMELERLAR